MSTTISQRAGQFYADIFTSIAEGMVSRPDDLQVKTHRGTSVSVREIEIPRCVVSVTPHANDFGALVGTDAKNLRAFKMLLRNAAALRQEQCELSIQEGVGEYSRPIPVPLCANWRRDDELLNLVWRTVEDCFGEIDKPTVEQQEGASVVTLRQDGVLPDEGFYGLVTLFKAWGRSQGRTVRIERAGR